MVPVGISVMLDLVLAVHSYHVIAYPDKAPRRRGHNMLHSLQIYVVYLIEGNKVMPICHSLRVYILAKLHECRCFVLNEIITFPM